MSTGGIKIKGKDSELKRKNRWEGTKLPGPNGGRESKGGEGGGGGRDSGKKFPCKRWIGGRD